MDWPIRMVAAMPIPNTEPIRKNMMLLALAVAVSAASPRNLPTQMALTDPFSDCAMLPARIGSANMSRLVPIGPSVSERVCLGFDMDNVVGIGAGTLASCR